MRIAINPRAARAALSVTAMLLLLAAPALADDAPAAVRVAFAGGETQVAKLTADAKCFSNEDGTATGLPDEMVGLKFTRRAIVHPAPTAGDVTMDAPAGSTVYLIIGVGPKGAAARDAAAAAGWGRSGHCHLGTRGGQIFKQAFAKQTHVSVPNTGDIGVIVVAKDLEAAGGATPAVATVAKHHRTDAAEDPVEARGRAVKVALPQTSINCLEVLEMGTGMMLGQTSEVVLTVTTGHAAKPTQLEFGTRVGPEMMTTRDEAMRFVRVQYPDWFASKAEVTFEDKYNGHDGGSIGAALVTLTLSAIQGVKIDPKVAITGDISANGKVRAIGGVAAKLRGATASNCTVVALPSDNYEQLADAAIYAGPSVIGDVQVIGIATPADALAAVRADRDAKLAQAVALFADVQQGMKKSPAYFKQKEATDKLAQVVSLAPQHLSAKLLLETAQGKAPRTLSPAATLYYTFTAAGGLMGELATRSGDAPKHPVPSGAVKSGLADLHKLRPMADPTVRPLVDAWIKFIESWDASSQGRGSPQAMEHARQALDDEMAKERADTKLMQKMLKEGI